MKRLVETLLFILFLGMISGFLPFMWIALFEVHPVIASAIISPIIIEFVKELVEC